jgi:hypothetical protein
MRVRGAVCRPGGRSAPPLALFATPSQGAAGIGSAVINGRECRFARIGKTKMSSCRGRRDPAVGRKDAEKSSGPQPMRKYASCLAGARGASCVLANVRARPPAPHLEDQCACLRRTRPPSVHGPFPHLLPAALLEQPLARGPTQGRQGQGRLGRSRVRGPVVGLSGRSDFRKQSGHRRLGPPSCRPAAAAVRSAHLVPSPPTSGRPNEG